MSIKKHLKGKKGYVSIEITIIAGLMIALGTFLIVEFNNEGMDFNSRTKTTIADTTIKMDDTHNKYVIVSNKEQ